MFLVKTCHNPIELCELGNGDVLIRNIPSTIEHWGIQFDGKCGLIIGEDKDLYLFSITLVK